jgi:L-malate glycosyltransferase
MLCSLKAYKGIYHFINIARKMKDLRFVLVLNTSQKEVNTLRKMVDIPENCFVHPSQSNTVPFYKQAHVVCNLSKPDGWVETFGMTLLEAMHCGRPVICPPVGGVLEVVEDGVQGFTIDSKEEDRICNVLRRLSEDLTYYVEMAQAAYEKSEQFDRFYFEKDLTDSFRFGKNVQKAHAIVTDFPKSGKMKMMHSVHNQPL